MNGKLPVSGMVAVLRKQPSDESIAERAHRMTVGEVENVIATLTRQFEQADSEQALAPLLHEIEQFEEAVKPDFSSRVHDPGCFIPRQYELGAWNRPGHKADRPFVRVPVADVPGDARLCRHPGCLGTTEIRRFRDIPAEPPLPMRPGRDALDHRVPGSFETGKRR